LGHEDQAIAVGSLGRPFLFEPDVDFPVVEGKAPPRARSSRSARDTASGVATEGER